MTGMETTMITLVVGLVFGGGGIWVGARGKVTKDECASKHKGEREVCLARHEGLEVLTSTQFAEVIKRLERIERKQDQASQQQGLI